MTKKCQKKADKAEDVKDFIEFRRKLYNSKRPFEKYESVCAKLLPKIYEIIDGRMASYKIFDDPDMRQDALVFMRYINRYDGARILRICLYHRNNNQFHKPYVEETCQRLSRRPVSR